MNTLLNMKDFKTWYWVLHAGVRGLQKQQYSSCWFRCFNRTSKRRRDWKAYWAHCDALAFQQRSVIPNSKLQKNYPATFLLPIIVIIIIITLKRISNAHVWISSCKERPVYVLEIELRFILIEEDEGKNRVWWKHVWIMLLCVRTTSSWPV